MSHANATLTPRGRLLLARCVVDDGWPLRRAAERFNVSHKTAERWADRYREFGRGRHGRPVITAAALPATHLPARIERRILGLRVSRRWGPARIAYRLGLAVSTVHRVLTRYGAPPLRFIDPATGVRVRTSRPAPRRYEHAAPGDLVHVDIKKLGRIPDGGGHRVHGRAAAQKIKKSIKPGYAYLHHAVDDHSRLAYSEILTDERKETVAAFWQRAHAYFADRGITVKRVLTDNGFGLPVPAVRRDPRRVDRPQAHPALPAPDQRQGRALQPHPARGMGLRPPVRQRSRASRGLRRLPAPLQPSPRPHRTRRTTPAARVTNLAGQYS